VNATPRYRVDFTVPEIHDISEAYEGGRNPTLDRLRAALAKDHRWERSMLAPWRPFGEEQHLIIWLDLAQRADKVILGEQVAKIVGGVLPGVRLDRVELQPP
jgi:hypothetical protein